MRVRRTMVALSVLFALGAAPARAAGPLTAERMWGLKRLAGPALSPDGKWAVVAVTTYDVKQDKGLTDLWLVATDGSSSRALTTHEAADSNAAWSPDGQWIAFESKRGDDENPQVYVIPATGGEARRVTSVPTGAFAARWFPDSRRLAFLSRIWTDLSSWDEMAKRQKERKDTKVSAKTFDKAPIRYWDTWLDDREVHVYAIALEGGEPVAITRGSGFRLPAADPGRSSYDIAPDGTEVAFVADTDPSGVEPNSDIAVVAAAGGAARNLTADNPAPDFGPEYSPDGKWLAYARQSIRGFYGDTARLALLDRKAGRATVTGEKWDRSVGSYTWMPDSKSLLSAVDDAGTGRLYQIEVPSGTPRPFTRERTFSAVRVSRDGRTVIALREAFTEPPTLVRVDPQGGGVTKISTFNDAALQDVEWGSYESVTYKGAQDENVQMWVNYPPGFDRTKKWPVFLLIHGGPHNGAQDAFQWRWNAQVFSGWGYVTAWPNFHGSSGFGQKFTDSINPNWADLPYEDVIKGAAWLAAQPFVDKARMTAGGGSYGGYLASLILGREHPFQALVAHAAVYNIFSQHAADYGAARRRHGEYWSTPDAAQMVAKISPHFGAGAFKTPTLVIHGERDYRVPVNHGLELFHTLQNKGVKSRLLYYPDENHWILKPQNSLHWYATVRDWLNDFVQEGPK